MLASFPSPLVPSTSTDNDALSVVAPPHKARLRQDMWVSSRTFYVLDAEVLWTARPGLLLLLFYVSHSSFACFCGSSSILVFTGCMMSMMSAVVVVTCNPIYTVPCL